jgi:hypothetical protein
MRRASVAEWILCRFTCRERARTMVGDLVEIGEQKGNLWFWLSLCGIVIALVWKRPLAFIAAFYAGSWALGAFANATYSIYSKHVPPFAWETFFNFLEGAGVFLWIAAVYAAIRFGYRGGLMRLALTAAAFVTAIDFYWWQPTVLATCFAAGFVGLWFFGVDRFWKSAIALCAVVVAGLAGWFLCISLEGIIQHLIYAGPLGTRELQEHPSILWVGFCAYLLSTWIATFACSIAHRWVTRAAPADSETGPSAAV